MSKFVYAAVAAAAFLTAGSANAAEQRPNIAGTYKCQTSASNCQWSGATFTVTQTGNDVEAKNEKNDVGHGTVTSNITVSMGPPWNMLGVMSNNNRQIEWSNGTLWQKQ